MDDDIKLMKKGNVAEDMQAMDDVDEMDYSVPKKLHWSQWILVAVLYIVLALLVTFIIYISATWNKARPNEYA